jgi:hypothetical protein
MTIQYYYSTSGQTAAGPHMQYPHPLIHNYECLCVCVCVCVCVCNGRVIVCVADEMKRSGSVRCELLFGPRSHWIQVSVLTSSIAWTGIV